jgi:WD40 repeat protein
LKTELKGHSKTIRNLSYFFDFEILLSISIDAQLKFWDTTSFAEVFSLQLEGKYKVFDLNQYYLVLAGFEGKLQILGLQRDSESKFSILSPFEQQISN